MGSVIKNRPAASDKARANDAANTGDLLKVRMLLLKEALAEYPHPVQSWEDTFGGPVPLFASEFLSVSNDLFTVLEFDCVATVSLNFISYFPFRYSGWNFSLGEVDVTRTIVSDRNEKVYYLFNPAQLP